MCVSHVHSKYPQVCLCMLGAMTPACIYGPTCCMEEYSSVYFHRTENDAFVIRSFLGFGLWYEMLKEKMLLTAQAYWCCMPLGQGFQWHIALPSCRKRQLAGMCRLQAVRDWASHASRLQTPSKCLGGGREAGHRAGRMDQEGGRFSGICQILTSFPACLPSWIHMPAMECRGSE